MPFAYDAFLSHHSTDHDAVQRVAQWLEDKGLTIWLDKWEIRPGVRWRDPTEAGLKTSRAVLVFVGPDGPGPWQQSEMSAALALQKRQGTLMIPIVLPGGDRCDLPLLFEEFSHVVLHSLDDSDGLAQLYGAITGERLRIASGIQPPTRDGPLRRLGRALRGGDVAFVLGRRLVPARENDPPDNVQLASQILHILEFLESGSPSMVLPPIDYAASCYSIAFSEGDLDEQVYKLIANGTRRLTSVHRRIAQILHHMRHWQRDNPIRLDKKPYQLIVTTSLDLLCERALVSAGLPFIRIVESRQLSDPIVTRFPAGEPCVISDGQGGSTDGIRLQGNDQPVALDDLVGLDRWIQGQTHRAPMSADAIAASGEPVLYKHQGSHDIMGSCVISTSHYFEALSRKDRMPDFVRTALAASPWVFVGFKPMDPDLRLLEHSLLRHVVPTETPPLRYASLEPPAADEIDDVAERKLWNGAKEILMQQLRLRSYVDDPPRIFLGQLFQAVRKELS